MEAEMGLHSQVCVSPTGATHKCLGTRRRLDAQLGPHTGVWDPETELHTGVGIPIWAYTDDWISNWGYTQVFGVPSGRSCKLPRLPTQHVITAPEGGALDFCSGGAFETFHRLP